MGILEQSIQIALTAHKEQVDKANKPYILHPLRVMQKMDNEIDMAAAVLHDVIEDSECTVAKLRDEGIPEAVIEIVACLTKADGESYQEYIERLSKNRRAKRIKIADLEDNLNIVRLHELSSKDVEKLRKYHSALKYLQSS